MIDHNAGLFNTPIIPDKSYEENSIILTVLLRECDEYLSGRWQRIISHLWDKLNP